MISYLSGNIKNLSEKSLTILTSGGIGYKVFTQINTILSLVENNPIEMLVHTVVRDDALDLYGFLKKEELQIFEKLISVSGIGPRSALNILAVSSVSDLANAIENQNLSSLPTVPGVGKKGLEKIGIELKGKLNYLIQGSQNKKSEETDAILALISLGYNQKDISQAINAIKKQIELEKEKNKDKDKNNAKKGFTDLSVNQIIKAALQELK